MPAPLAAVRRWSDALRPTLGAAVLSLVVTSLVFGVQGSRSAQTSPRLTAHELPSLRTATSKTFVEPDGSYRTVVSAEPVNYRDARGHWRSIGSGLADSGKRGYRWASRANRFHADFRDRTTAGGGLLSFATGSNAAFTLALDGSRAARARKESASSLRYDGVQRGVSLEYAVVPTGVKESIVLQAGAPDSYRFTLHATQGGARLRAVSEADGSVGFSLGGGASPVFSLAAPVVSESVPTTLGAGVPGPGNPMPLVLNAPGSAPAAAGKASLGVERISTDTFSVTVRVDPTWLHDPRRIFPVVVDPTITVGNDVQDGSWDTAAGTNTPNTSGTELSVGPGGGTTYASGLVFDLGSIPASARVTTARVGMNLASCFGTCPTSPTKHIDLTLSRLTSGWTSSTPWSSVTKAGSSSAATAFDMGNGKNHTGDWIYLDSATLASDVQNMVSGATPNYGFLLEGGGAPDVGVKFASSRFADPTRVPRLVVEWSSQGVQIAPITRLHANGAELSWSHYDGGLGPYPQAVLANSPKGYWRLDDAADSPLGVADWSGNANHGTVSGTVSQGEPGATADGDPSTYFDGSSGEVTVPASPTINAIADTFTAEAWIKLASTATGKWQTIFGRGGTNSGGGFRFQVNSTNHLRLGTGTGSTPPTIADSTTAISDTNWHFAAVTKSGASVHLYLDGVDVTPATITNATATGAASICIAQNCGGASPFNGWIDDAAIWGAVLTPAQIQAHYTAGSQAIAGFEDHEIHRSTVSGFTPDASNLVQTIGDPTVQTYRDTTAAPSTTFYYKIVTATDAGSYVSNEVAAALPADGHSDVAIQPGIGTDDIKATSIVNFTGDGCASNDGADQILQVDSGWRSLLQFDLRAIPSGATVTNAHLSLYATSPASRTISLFRITSDWTEGINKALGCNGNGAGWSERKKLVKWTTPGGDYAPSMSASASCAAPCTNPQWVDWADDTAGTPPTHTFSDLVQGWLDGGFPNLGMLLLSPTGSGTAQFASDDYSVSPALRPKLVVDYNDPSAHANPPQVAIGLPGPNRVSGTTTVTAGASDDGHVTKVQFRLDGGDLGAPVASPPYQLSWNTATATRGAHTLTAVATDDAGNVTTSSPVTVTVSNSSAPATSITTASNQTQTSGYAEAVAADDPSAYWRLGEASGDSFDDEIAGLQGAWTGSPTLGAEGALAADSNGAVTLDGTSQDGTVDDGAAIDFSNQMSIEAWVNTSASGAQAVATHEGSYELRVVDGHPEAEFDVSGRFGSATVIVTSSDAIDGGWHQLAATFNRGSASLYVDGVDVADQLNLSIFTLLTGTSGLEVGSDAGGSFFDGSIDELAVYPTALSPTAIADHHDAGTNPGTSQGPDWDVTASASDDVGVTKVEFYVDGSRFATDATSPYEATLKTLALPVYDGSHTLTAKAYDADGNATTSSSYPITVANGAGTEYKSSISTSSTVPIEMSYDPNAPSQDSVPVDVHVTNQSSSSWSSAAVSLRYRWLDSSGNEVSHSSDISIGSDLGPGGSTTVSATVAPPTLPASVMRGRFTLRFDLYDAAGGSYFAAHGSPPLDRTITVTRVQPDELGLERYQMYDGEDLGGSVDAAVNLFNGNSVVQWAPFSEPGIGLNTEVSLTYNSLEQGSVSPLGNGWSLAISGVTPLGLPLDIHPNAADTAAGRSAKWVGFTDADGTYHRFAGNADGTYYTPPAGVHLYLRHLSGGGWQLVKPDRTTFTFDGGGYPTGVQDADGNTLTYTQETPASGEDAYGLAKRVTAVTDEGGRSFNLAYYSAAEAPTAAVRGKLKSLADHVGHALTFEYYDDGNLRRVIEQGGTNADGSYLPDRALVFTYTNVAGTGPAIGDPALRVDPDPSTVEGTKLYSERDFRGHETVFTYSADGRLASRTNRAGNVTGYSWDSATRTATVAMPLGRTWHYAFDTSGRATRITDPVDPSDTTVTWNSDNEVQRVTEASGRHVDFTYNANGYLLSKSDELGDTTTLAYQSFPVEGNDTAANWETGRSIGHISRLVTVVKPVGNATPTNPTDYTWTYTYTNDTTDHVATSTDPLGKVTANAWNADGTLASTTLPSNAGTIATLGFGDTLTRTTTYGSYDTNGLPTKLTDAAGGVTQAGYRANGAMVWSQDPDHATYDPSHPGDPDPTAYRSEIYYDAFGRPDRTSQPKSTSLWPGLLIWGDTAYDAGDNDVGDFNPHHGAGDDGAAPETTTAYDAMDRATLATGPRRTADGGPVQTQTTYDDAGRAATVTAPNGMLTATPGDFTTTTTYDALDRTATTTTSDGNGADDRTAHYCYDLAGDMRTMTGPRGSSSFTGCPAIPSVGASYVPYAGSYTAEFDYDAAHRQLSVTDPLGNRTQTTYDANGATLSTTDASNHTTAYTYDARGARLTEVDPYDGTRAVTTQLQYDALGDLGKLISPRAFDNGAGSGPDDDYVTTYRYDQLKRLVTTKLPKRNAPSDPKNTPQAYQYNGYDANGELTTTSLPTLKTDPSQLNADDTTTTTYWDTGAIASSADPNSARTHFDYTAEGWQASRVPELPASPGVLDYTRAEYWDYTADGLLASLRDLGGERAAHSYDADGNQVSATQANGITSSSQTPLVVQATFDGFGELTKVRTPKPATPGTWMATTFAYDADQNPTTMIENAQENDAGTQTAAGREEDYVYNQADQATSQVDNFATTATTTDDEQLTYTYWPTGQPNMRTLFKRPSGTWTQEQKSARSYFDNGLLKELTNSDGANNALEDHKLSYVGPAGAYQNGNRASDVFYLKGPVTSAPCRSSTAPCTATWAYDARDRLVQAVNGTGTTTTYALDGCSCEPQDASGNVTTETATGQPTITRTYDGQRLQTMTKSGTTTRSVYDGFGNVDCTVKSTWAAVQCPDEGAAELLTDNGYDYANRFEASRTYNGSGTLTSSADYINDPLNRVVSETETHGTSTTTTQSTYIGLSSVLSREVVTGTGAATKTYVYDALGQRATITNGTTRYSYLYDPQGSVSMLLDQSNGVKAAYGYDAYGNPNTSLTKNASGFSATTNPFTYQGKRFDSGSNTIDMGARRYDPSSERFMQQDQYAGALDDLGLSTDPITANRYALTGSNPINFVEFDGHRPQVDPGEFVIWHPWGGDSPALLVNGSRGVTANQDIVKGAEEVEQREEMMTKAHDKLGVPEAMLLNPLYCHSDNDPACYPEDAIAEDCTNSCVLNIAFLFTGVGTAEETAWFAGTRVAARYEEQVTTFWRTIVSHKQQIEAYAADIPWLDQGLEYAKNANRFAPQGASATYKAIQDSAAFIIGAAGKVPNKAKRLKQIVKFLRRL